MIEEFQIINSKKGLADLRRVLERIAESWDLSQKQLFEINLILEELCANYIDHVGADPVSLLEVKLFLAGSNLSITFKDTGPPFDPTIVQTLDVDLPIEKRSAGGVGLHLIKHYTDTISYSRENKKNVIHMEKRLV